MCLTGCSSPAPPTAGPAPSAPACNPAIQSCPCCAVLSIHALTFGGHTAVERDTMGYFPTPEWMSGRPEQSPVGYPRNTRIQVAATFRITTAACLASEAVEIRGRAVFGGTLLEWTGSTSVRPGDTEVTISMTSHQPLPNEVGLFESTDISWQANRCNNGWTPAGTSRNIVYVTLGPLAAGAINHWTLLDISCRAAAGAQNEADLVSRSFDAFRGKVGDGNGFRRKRDGVELTYYKNGAGTPSSGVFSCADLLSRGDGTGRCGAWARFLVAMHQVHGITSSAVFGVVPRSAPLLIVKNCTFSSNSLPVPFPFAGRTQCVKIDGIFGQGKNNPQCTFGDHALVRYGTRIYDPSYGVGPVADLHAWETGGIAGIGQMPPVSFMFAGDPHFLPGSCSPGFIEYTAGAGDTLASIATAFGIPSRAVLYGHGYNAAYRASHPPPGEISPGDRIRIPRDVATTLTILRIV